MFGDSNNVFVLFCFEEYNVGYNIIAESIIIIIKMRSSDRVLMILAFITFLFRYSNTPAVISRDIIMDASMDINECRLNANIIVRADITHNVMNATLLLIIITSMLIKEKVLGVM